HYHLDAGRVGVGRRHDRLRRAVRVEMADEHSTPRRIGNIVVMVARGALQEETVFLGLYGRTGQAEQQRESEEGEYLTHFLCSFVGAPARRMMMHHRPRLNVRMS